MDPLPIDALIPDIVAQLEQRRALVIVAEPGAGKTTRVPPALIAPGPVLLLQPRRAAARSIARRIADERGWTLGREVGWHVRFERRASIDTRLLVATEGILTASAQRDPLLSDYRTVVLDEFHERSIHADLGLAFTRQAWLARDDLRIVVMSATLDAAGVSAFLHDCPIVRVPGRIHPIEVAYAPGLSPAEGARTLLDRTPGDVLCFLPGAYEIGRTIGDLRGQVPETTDLLPLHGGLDAIEQDRVLGAAPDNRRRIVVATNIAETSVTVPGITGVVDAGLQKVARFDAARAIDSLVTERVTDDAATQRAGRAGRTGPGHVLRLWDARDRLRTHREPDLHRIDLSATLLDIVAWGGLPTTFEWFEAPRPDAVDRALGLLERLGALHAGSLTEIGRRMQGLSLHPRLARILIALDGAPLAARACAILSERAFLPARTTATASARQTATASDLLSALDRWDDVPRHVQQVARDLGRITAAAMKEGSGTLAQAESLESSEWSFRRAILCGYPDRVGQRRDPRSARFLMASGVGAEQAPESGVHDAEFIVALDLMASSRPGVSEGRIRLASRVERDWLSPTSRERRHWVDESGHVRAADVERYEALVLGEHPARPDPVIAAQLLAKSWLEHDPPVEATRLLRRLHFSGCALDLPHLVAQASQGARSLADLDIARALPAEARARVDREAPEQLVVPSGRSVRLEYVEDGTVAASVKLQELFGLAETPRIGLRREPVLLALLAPNGRPVQVTRDLRSFWNGAYADVRRELRGRYPRHPWPDDPWNATPTARAKPRK